MRKFLALMAVVLFVSSTSIAFAMPTTDVPSLHKVNQGPQPGAMFNSTDLQGAAKVDTLVWGWYEDRYAGTDSAGKYARRNEVWTWDHGSADPLEGWTSVDETQNTDVYWRPMTSALWAAEANGTGAFWPQMVGNGMLVCGTTLNQANLLSYLNGLGYGPVWGQQVVSPTLQYDGTGDITLDMKYFSEAEVGYDYLKVYLEVDEPATPFYKKLLLNGPNGWDGAGVQVNHSTGVITPITYNLPITQLMIGNGTVASHFRIIVEFKSDGGVSDYDGPLDTMYGACGIDEVTLTGNLIANAAYTFDGGTLEGWTAEALQGVGAFMGRANRELDYIVGDPCACALTGGVLEMHSDIPSDRHPNGQEEALISPIVSRKVDIGSPAYLAYNRIMAEWDQYADMPQANGVFYRPGWKYYPYHPPALPALTIWSPRIGQDTWHYVGDVAVCYGTRAIGTDWGLPTNAEKVQFVYEINSNCDSFGITNCTGVTNFSPIIDNATVRTVGYVDAPVALFEPGTQFTDGFGMGSLGVLSTTDAGNADIVYNLRMGSPVGTPTRLGDSLMVTGPVPSSAATKWEAKMWFRLRRVGPGQTLNATYNIWKPAMGANVDYPNFAWGYMDSVEVGGAQRNKFCSYFRELAPAGGLTPEPKFSWGPDTGDKDPGNEIFPDGCFTPGTKLEYFITTNWIGTPTAYYYYPDTAGGAFREFEILPSFRSVDATEKFPCFLFVDAVDNAPWAASHYLIQRALNEVLNNNSPAIPAEPTTWDRFDYMDVTSNWHGTTYREPLGNSGASMCQLLGYKTIFVSLGDASAGAMWPRCWQGFDEWLKATVGDGNVNRQGLIVDGTAAGYIVPETMLNGTMGATRVAIAYNAVNPPVNEVNCPRIVPVGSAFDPGIATNAYGNWCPDKERFSVLGTTGSGVGNKQFQNPNTLALTSFSQVINDKLGAPYNYRTVIDSFSYMRIFPASAGACIVPTDADVVNAAKVELKNAINWTMGWGLTDKAVVPLCVNTCTDINSVPDEEGTGALVTRLYQNHPNPFNPRTVIKFSLAADGPTKLVIYDVNGRRVRTLVNELQKAGPHEAVWDGTDDAGRTVTSGVYWSQLQAGDYSSNKKMVVLK
jgi:hypothetical protein